MSEWNFYESLSLDEQAAIVDEATRELSDGLSFRQIVDVDQLTPRAMDMVQRALNRRRQEAGRDVSLGMAEQVVARVGGLGFLLPLLRRADLSEIALIPDGSLWVLPKGAHDFERVDLDPTPQEVGRAVEALLRPVGRSVNEAAPSVDAKLPRIESLPGLKGGARVKILHPVIVPGRADFPSINIRLFEPLPVLPQRLVDWQMAPQAVIDGLLHMVSSAARLLVIGGTASGKTTFLSAMTNGIPKNARVVKIEDPEEIWMDHPHVVTVEARRAPVGSTSVKDYSLKDGVDDAMRMSPRWLIVGEVRTGDAAAALFRAQMSDHPGLSTFHADGPELAVERMGLNMFVDAGIKLEGAKRMFSMAVDVVAQVGWLGGRRRLLGVWEVDRQLKAGDVQFRPLYLPSDDELKALTRRGI